MDKEVVSAIITGIASLVGGGVGAWLVARFTLKQTRVALLEARRVERRTTIGAWFAAIERARSAVTHGDEPVLLSAAEQLRIATHDLVLVLGNELPADAANLSERVAAVLADTVDQYREQQETGVDPDDIFCWSREQLAKEKVALEHVSNALRSQFQRWQDGYSLPADTTRRALEAAKPLQEPS